MPYKRKHYIDIIAQPGQTFSFDPASGYSGLVTRKPAAVIYARGGAYGGEGSGTDHQKPYVEQILGFFGFTDIHPIVIEPTLAAPDDLAKTIATARRNASLCWKAKLTSGTETKRQPWMPASWFICPRDYRINCRPRERRRPSCWCF